MPIRGLLLFSQRTLQLFFDGDQHSEVHSAGNDHSLALICKGSTIFYGHLRIYLAVTQSKIEKLVQNTGKNVIEKYLYTFLFKTQNLYFLPQ